MKTMLSLLLRRAYAQPVTGCPDPNNNPPCLPQIVGTTNFVTLLDKIFGFLFVFATIVAPILLIYAGIQMLVAAGDPEKIKTAHRTIWYTLIGFAIIVLAKGIVLVIAELFSTPT